MSTLLELPSSASPIEEVPLTYGVIVYPGYQALDIFGPLDALNSLSLGYPLQLYVIAETMEPVSTKPPGGLNNPASDFGQSIVPTHTFETVPPIDVLIVPGGIGNRAAANVEAAIKYIGKIYPTLQYLIAVCTGSRMVAQAGVLDGKRATTNKRAWTRTIEFRPQVKWEPHARWVVDGNIWTSSGVSAGFDVIFAFMGEVYGEEVAKMIADFMEYERHTDPTWDPYADLYGL
ncbi:DJ-1/PfpI family protein [Flammula alnicola]|nr:DJ-1/PfpI family protein [Flammula alnicola]